MLNIEGAVAVITGGSGGIGMSLASKWLELGGRAVIADINEEALRRARAALGGGVETFVCNVTKEEDAASLAAFAMEKMGQINMVAPFAGIIKDAMMVSPDRETGKVSRKMSLADFQMVIDINLTGVFLTVRECAEQMINNNCKGLICLVSSTGSLGTAGQINYSSTKAAMAVMPKVITADKNQKVLYRIISEVPIGRLIEPEEVATLACDIYRNEALAGETYFIHGGLRLGSKG